MVRWIGRLKSLPKVLTRLNSFQVPLCPQRELMVISQTWIPPLETRFVPFSQAITLVSFTTCAHNIPRLDREPFLPVLRLNSDRNQAYRIVAFQACTSDHFYQQLSNSNQVSLVFLPSETSCPPHDFLLHRDTTPASGDVVCSYIDRVV